MDFIADILLVAGAFGAGIYCIVLGRRLNRFNDLEKGVGGAVAVLSAQIDDLTKTLSAAQKAAEHSSGDLNQLAARAERVSKQLELQLASMHDMPANSEPAPIVQSTAHQPVSAEPMFVRHRQREVQQ